MTDKRFTVDDGLENVLCWEINDKENEDMTCGECAKLLNELHEENEQLRKENKLLIQGIKDTAKQGADTITAVWESKNRPQTMKRGYYD